MAVLALPDRMAETLAPAWRRVVLAATVVGDSTAAVAAADSSAADRVDFPLIFSVRVAALRSQFSPVASEISAAEMAALAAAAARAA
jgi:hypothetical protein